MIPGLTNSESVDVLERLMQFAGQRHRIIVNNVANLSTPGYRPVDVSVARFQDQLARAIEARRSCHEPLALASSEQVEVSDHGMALRPEPIGGNILFHDSNDRNLETTMQDLVENFMVFRTAGELLRSRLDLLSTAISQRV